MIIAKETGILALLAALAAGMIFVRFRRRPDSNWLPVFWTFLLIAGKYFEVAWDNRIIAGGLGAALILRYEFLSDGFETFFRTAEMGCFGYILYREYALLMYF